jgi:hypothetical protein
MKKHERINRFDHAIETLHFLFSPYNFVISDCLKSVKRERQITLFWRTVQ